MKIPSIINAQFLRRNPQVVFVFGDNLLRKGKGGAAALRNEPNTYGFVTKKYPNNFPGSFYTRNNYPDVFKEEWRQLVATIVTNPQKIYLISKLGAGLANKYNIYDTIIKHSLPLLKQFSNVQLLD